MEIYYITNSRMPTEKAHGAQIVKMCEAFGELDEVTLVVPKRRNSIMVDLFKYYNLRSNFKVVYLPCWDLVWLGKFGFWIQMVTFAFSVKFLLKIPDDALIYSRDHLSLYFLLRKRNKKYIEIHDEVPDKSVWRKVILGVDGVASTNNYKKDELSRLFGISKNKIFVAPNGVDPAYFINRGERGEIRTRLNIPNNKIILGYVGSFFTKGRENGVGDVIRAVVEIEDKNVVALFVGGTNIEIEIFKNMANSLGVADRCLFIPHVPIDEVADYYLASDILLMTFPLGKHYERVMSPIRMFWYMLSGRPIITSDLSSIREILDESCAYFYKSGNVTELVSMIKHVLNNKNEATLRAVCAEKRGRGYSWQARANSIIRFIKED